MLPTGNMLRVRLRDLHTGNILFESSPGAALVSSSKRYFLKVRIEVFEGEEIVFAHDYNAAGRRILIQFPVRAMFWAGFPVR
jgi:hypothetical protein